ncbi:MAG: NUDIX hydrolase [Chloroflexi bacterium]|nr:NUDIX hydrolase [Chloroflexota bacterium]
MVTPIFTLGVLGAAYKDDRVLLVKTNYSGEKWQLPGGYVESYESADEALRREIMEELGLSSTILGFIGTYIRQQDHNIVLAFEIALSDGLFQIQESEISDIRYFNINGLPNEISNRTRKIVNDAMNQQRGKVCLFKSKDDFGITI